MKSACIITALALLAFACSTSKPPPSTDPGSNTDTGSTEADGGNDGGTPNGNGDGAPPSGGNADAGPPCSGEASSQSCVGCCASAHQSGAALFNSTLLKCLCLTDNCSADCKDTYCAATPKNPDNACNACVDKQRDNCAKTVEDACTPDEDCKAFNQCLTDAECSKKK
jgi:hypothetical protein